MDVRGEKKGRRGEGGKNGKNPRVKIYSGSWSEKRGCLHGGLQSVFIAASSASAASSLCTLCCAFVYVCTSFRRAVVADDKTNSGNEIRPTFEVAVCLREARLCRTENRK